MKRLNQVQLLKKTMGKRVALWINLLRASLIGFLTVCLYLMIFHTKGECLSDLNGSGCLTSYNLLNLHIAFLMIVADTILFSLFCYKFYKIICLLKEQENVTKIPSNAWNGFIMQFTCVSISMLTCVLDGTIHFLYVQYDMKLFFVCDVIIVSMCNMAMLKETQQALLRVIKRIKLICCYYLFKKRHEEKEKQIAKMVHMAKMNEKTLSKKEEEQNGGSPPQQTQIDDNANTESKNMDVAVEDVVDSKEENVDTPKTPLMDAVTMHGVDSAYNMQAMHATMS